MDKYIFYRHYPSSCDYKFYIVFYGCLQTLLNILKVMVIEISVYEF
jgi:hypothetical protein